MTKSTYLLMLTIKYQIPLRLSPALRHRDEFLRKIREAERYADFWLCWLLRGWKEALFETVSLYYPEIKGGSTRARKCEAHPPISIDTAFKSPREPIQRHTL